MRKTVEQVFARYGTDMTVEGKTVRGFFRALNHNGWQTVERAATPLGETSRRKYAYMGPADTAVAEGDTLRLGGRSYLFSRVEIYYVQHEPLYIWGVCVEKGEGDLWEIPS